MYCMHVTERSHVAGSMFGHICFAYIPMSRTSQHTLQTRTASSHINFVMDRLCSEHAEHMIRPLQTQQYEIS